MYNYPEELSSVFCQTDNSVNIAAVQKVDCDTCCWSPFKFFYQSGVDGFSENDVVSEKTDVTMSFLEGSTTYSTGSAASHPASATADATTDVSLSNFLSRPVKISSYTWTQADSIGTTTTIEPWHLFFSNATIQNKLANYAWLRCDLKVKVMVNSSPFNFGATMASYQPLPNFKASTIVNDAATRWLIPTSQRPHIWIYPQNNEGGEMTLPFFLFKNYISTVSAQDFKDMGKLNFINYTVLDSANGAATIGVTVNIYAWAENVVVSGPSAGLMLQSKDEYGKGPVSSVASAVASAAHALRNVPIIGPYATATQMGAKAVASVASSLGYCNTPVIEDSKPVKLQHIPVLASTEQGYPIEKFTIDPKNELSVDPQIVGLPPIDELNIQHLVSRESYLTTINWNTAQALDTLLFQSAVTPVMYDCNADAQAKIYHTPISFVAQLFRYWRGDIIFRFRFIATQYHRGRVRIVFDPSGSAAQNITTTAVTQPMCFNEVIDVTKDTNVELRIPYNQAYGWLRTFQPTNNSQIPFTTSTTPTFNHVDGSSNGSIVMRIVNVLTAPVTSSTIQCIVSVRGAENLEFGSPCDVSQKYTQFAVQSKDEYEVSPSTKVIAGTSPSGEIPEKYLINMGENIVTLRQLLRRYNLQYVRTYTSVATNVWQTGYNVHTAMPMHLGYDTSGQYSAKGLITTGTDYPYNYVCQTPLTYISSAFIGYRGSVNYNLTVNGNDSLAMARNMRASRVTNVVATPGYATQDTLGTNQNTTAKWFTIDTSGYITAGGTALSQVLTNNGLNYSCPMYSKYKFLSLDKTSPTLASWAIDDRELFRTDALIPVTSTLRTVQYVHAAIGTDWNCHFFLNVPTFYVMSATPTPT